MTPPAALPYLAEMARYRGLIEKTLAQLPDERLNEIPAAEANSVAMLIRHLSGNLRSRFTDFLTTDGEKPWRARDAEFETGPYTRAALEAMWAEAWGVVEAALGGLTSEDAGRTVRIRGEALRLDEALARALAHLAYHAGQIVLLGRMAQQERWQWLSIPKSA